VAAIETAGLTKRYGPVTAVDDLSFAVREGAVTGFLGPNGAGKTTTLRMILALARPAARCRCRCCCSGSWAPPASSAIARSRPPC
jgi:ABC-type multidrug transport system ATPase subunit